MIGALAALLVLQLAGEVLVRVLGLPLPGPVLGMLLLFAALLLRGRAPTELAETAHTILRHLSLLFIPAGVGVIVHLEPVYDVWGRLLVTVVASTIITIVVTAFALVGVQRLVGHRESP